MRDELGALAHSTRGCVPRVSGASLRSPPLAPEALSSPAQSSRTRRIARATMSDDTTRREKGPMETGRWSESTYLTHARGTERQRGLDMARANRQRKRHDSHQDEGPNERGNMNHHGENMPTDAACRIKTCGPKEKE